MYAKPTPRPQVRIIKGPETPSEAMRKWLLEGQNTSKNKNTSFI